MLEIKESPYIDKKVFSQYDFYDFPGLNEANTNTQKEEI